MARQVDPETGEILDRDIVTFGQSSWDPPLPPTMAMIAVEPGMDLSVRALGDEAIKLSLYAGRLVIDNATTAKCAINDIAICRDMIKQVEDEQKKWLAPLEEAKKRIKAGFDLILSPLKAANDAMTGKLSAWKLEEKRKADEAAEIARRTQELEALKAILEGRDPVIQTLPPAIPVAKTTRGAIADATMTGTWKWRWNDKLSLGDRLEHLPIAYHMANESLIGAAVRSKAKTGITEADFNNCLVIYYEESMRIAPKRVSSLERLYD